jgi:hypothetical protein
MLLGGGSNCQGCGCNPVRCFDLIDPYSDYDYFDNASFLAGGINIGSSSQTLSSVTIYNGGSTSGSPYCTVWPNDTTDTSLPYGPRPKPRPLLSSGIYGFPPECVFLSPPGSFSGSTWTFTHGGLTLNANTIYWIVMSGQSVVPGTFYGNGSGGWTWEDFGVNGGTPSEQCYFLSSYSTNAGVVWSENFPTNRYRFDWS